MNKDTKESVDNLIDEVVDGRIEPLDKETEKDIDNIIDSYNEE